MLAEEDEDVLAADMIAEEYLDEERIARLRAM
jgi:hypothetical protein